MDKTAIHDLTWQTDLLTLWATEWMGYLFGHLHGEVGSMLKKVPPSREATDIYCKRKKEKKKACSKLEVDDMQTCGVLTWSFRSLQPQYAPVRFSRQNPDYLEPHPRRNPIWLP